MRTVMVNSPVKALGMSWDSWRFTDKDHLQITVREKRHVTAWLAMFGEAVEVQAGGPPENFVVASVVWDADAVLVTLEAVPDAEVVRSYGGKWAQARVDGVKYRTGIITHHEISRSDTNGGPGPFTETITIDLEPRRDDAD